MGTKLGSTVIHKEDLKFVEEYLSHLKIPFGTFEKDVLVGHAVFTLKEIRRSFEEISLLTKNEQAIFHLTAELTQFLQGTSHFSPSYAAQVARDQMAVYFEQLDQPIKQAVLEPIEYLLNNIPTSNMTLTDWLNRALLVFKVVEDDSNVLLKYMGKYHVTLTNPVTGQVVTQKNQLEIASTSLSAYLREASVYAKSNSHNIEAWKEGLLERQKINPDILKMIIEKGANKLVFGTQVLTFAIAVTFVFVGIFADDIFDAASAKKEMAELVARNGYLSQRNDEYDKKITSLQIELESLKKKSRTK